MKLERKGGTYVLEECESSTDERLRILLQQG